MSVTTPAYDAEVRSLAGTEGLEVVKAEELWSLVRTDNAGFADELVVWSLAGMEAVTVAADDDWAELEEARLPEELVT